VQLIPVLPVAGLAMPYFNTCFNRINKKIALDLQVMCFYTYFNSCFNSSLKSTMARPRKNPDALKVKVTLTLEPRIHQAAREAAYLDGVSLSEKIDELLAGYVATSHPHLASKATVLTETLLQLNQQGLAKMIKKKAMREGKTAATVNPEPTKVVTHVQ